MSNYASSWFKDQTSFQLSSIVGVGRGPTISSRNKRLFGFLSYKQLLLQVKRRQIGWPMSLLEKADLAEIPDQTRTHSNASSSTTLWKAWSQIIKIQMSPSPATKTIKKEWRWMYLYLLFGTFYTLKKSTWKKRMNTDCNVFLWRKYLNQCSRTTDNFIFIPHILLLCWNLAPTLPTMPFDCRYMSHILKCYAPYIMKKKRSSLTWITLLYLYILYYSVSFFLSIEGTSSYLIFFIEKSESHFVCTWQVFFC